MTEVPGMYPVPEIKPSEVANTGSEANFLGPDSTAPVDIGPPPLGDTVTFISEAGPDKQPTLGPLRAVAALSVFMLTAQKRNGRQRINSGGKDGMIY